MEVPPKISPCNCPNCAATMILPEGSTGSTNGCHQCGRRTRVITFPAYSRGVAALAAAEPVMTEGESACFYHPQKRAVVPCDLCGRFLCAICDLEFSGRHVCPQCLESGARKGKLQALERERMRWDIVVGVTLFFPLIFCWIFLPLTSLVALGTLVWKWNAPPSLVSNTRVRLIVYAGIAFLELAGGTTAWWLIISGR